MEIIDRMLNESMRKIEENLKNPSHCDEEEKRIAEIYERDRRERSNSLIGKSGIPNRHKLSKTENEGPWFDSYIKIESRLGTGFIFVLMGIRGTGKTQIGTNLIIKNCEKGFASSYTKAIDIFIDLRSAFRKDGDQESEIIKKYTAPNLLVIDAMEERGETAFEDRLLNHIIDKRYDNMRDTILITNQNKEKFSESVGPSIISRIHETGEVILCNWESYRSK